MSSPLLPHKQRDSCMRQPTGPSRSKQIPVRDCAEKRQAGGGPQHEGGSFLCGRCVSGHQQWAQAVLSGRISAVLLLGPDLTAMTVQGGDKLVVDPNMEEKASCVGVVLVVINNGHELCCQNMHPLHLCYALH